MCSIVCELSLLVPNGWRRVLLEQLSFCSKIVGFEMIILITACPLLFKIRVLVLCMLVCFNNVMSYTCSMASP